ncbi:FitA-like ribbon-helix-helix domain-containing protein [Microbacterium sp.]|uniref:FitA-like ribbon-helix-helix domain-containing protein n=1 Tax=Microbacterium sp. TaxID=51671 RepID=UPI0039E6630B
MIQVRNVPDDIHARLKERAAAEHLSLSDYLNRELAQLVRYRSNAEIVAAFRARGLRLSREQILDAVHEERDHRDAQLFDRLRDSGPSRGESLSGEGLR